MRSCGTCDACCVSMEVPGVNKPKDTPCVYLKGGTKKCSIYADKPEECSSFKCLWLIGLGNSKDRPDRSGILLYGSSSTFGEAVIASDCWLDASKQPRGKATVDKARELCKRIGAHLMVRTHAPITQTHSLCDARGDNEE